MIATLVGAGLAWVAVRSFRRARAVIDAAMAEIDEACCTYDIEQPGVRRVTS